MVDSVLLVLYFGDLIGLVYLAKHIVMVHSHVTNHGQAVFTGCSPLQ